MTIFTSITPKNITSSITSGLFDHKSRLNCHLESNKNNILTMYRTFTPGYYKLYSFQCYFRLKNPYLTTLSYTYNLYLLIIQYITQLKKKTKYVDSLSFRLSTCIRSLLNENTNELYNSRHPHSPTISRTKQNGQ